MIGIDRDHQMQVVAHHGIGMDRAREAFGDRTNPRLDPRLAMFEGTAVYSSTPRRNALRTQCWTQW